MPTDIRKLNLEDLLGHLYVAYVNPESDEGDATKIEAEIARRFEVRDILVASLLEGHSMTYQVWGPRTTKGRIVSTRRGEDDSHPPTYYIDGEQIL